MQSDLTWTHESDLSTDSLEDIGRALASVDTPDAQVIAVWPWDGRAGRATLRALAEAIEWIWAPASEDLVVLEAGERWVAFLDHEEGLRVRSS